MLPSFRYFFFPPLAFSVSEMSTALFSHHVSTLSFFKGSFSLAVVKGGGSLRYSPDYRRPDLFNSFVSPVSNNLQIWPHLRPGDCSTRDVSPPTPPCVFQFTDDNTQVVFFFLALRTPPLLFFALADNFPPAIVGTPPPPPRQVQYFRP